MIDVVDLFNACLYIQENLEADLSLLFLAQFAGLSRFRFHRVFKAWRGETLHEFVTRVRMERAAFELSYPMPKSSRRSIKAIAFASGYKSLSSFSHAFSAYAQVSPREYRNRALRAGIRPKAQVADHGRLGRYAIVVREEPEREIAVFDPVTRAGQPLGNAGREALRSTSWVAGDRYGVELLPYLFVRSRRARTAGSKPAALSCVGITLEDWRNAPIRHRDRSVAPRTTVRLQAGRYAVVSGKGGIASLYRAWCRHFDGWLAVAGECPRAARVYLRFNEPADGSGLEFSLYLPLEAQIREKPVGARAQSGGPTPEFV